MVRKQATNSSPAVIRPSRIYDVCVIGSGPAGTIAAYVLTRAGCSVALLEAGPAVDPVRDFKQHIWPYELPRRGLGQGGIGDDLFAPHGGYDIKGEPYVSAPGTNFRWFRARCLGGRSNHWGHGIARFEPVDFHASRIDGVGEEWPVEYEDLEPCYVSVENTIGVYGAKSTMPAPQARCTELFIAEACARLGIPCTTASAAIITKPFANRPPCHYCGQCGRGCISGSNFNAAIVLLPLAHNTGRLTLVTHAMAREILINEEGKAHAISYVDTKTRSERRIASRVTVLAAGACESARLLLNSTSRTFPTGLANSSGVVGRYLRDSVASQGRAYFPALQRIPPHNHDGAARHLRIPWWRGHGESEFRRGYRLEFGGGRHMPVPGDFDDVCESSDDYGLLLKQQCKARYGTTIFFVGFGEMLANNDSFCEIDPNIMDCWGIPVLRFHFKWGENEVKMAADMQKTIENIVEAAGGVYLTHVESCGEYPYGMSIGGDNCHELGTVRMGTDKAMSVLNRVCQSHDVANLFVVDGGCFVTSPEKPPTLTIMALSWMASEYIVQQFTKGFL